MKNITADIIMAAGLAISLLLGSFGGFAQECEAVQSEVLRLHIPANSDSEYDQQMKLSLRDFVLEEFGTRLSSASALPEAQQCTKTLLPEIERECCRFLTEHGADYSAKAELVEMYFTTRVYENVTLPAGTYTALRITLGKGEGHNWWCVMFPPLCIPMSTDRSETEAMLPQELLNNEGGEIKIKFALFELLKNLIHKD